MILMIFPPGVMIDVCLNRTSPEEGKGGVAGRAADSDTFESQNSKILSSTRCMFQ